MSNPCIKHVAALLHVSGPESSRDLVFREHVVDIALRIKDESDAMVKEIAALKAELAAAVLSERERIAAYVEKSLLGALGLTLAEDIRARGGK